MLKPRLPNPQHPNWWSPPKHPPHHSRKFLISSIDFPPSMCGSDSSPPHVHLLPSTGTARPRAVLKTVIFSWPNMAACPRRTERNKVLRLACWNADGVRGRKLELEHFRNQHGVDICLLSETFLKPGQAFLLANYVSHRTDRMIAGAVQPSCSAMV